MAPRSHRKLVVAILVVATLLGLVSVLSIWVKRQALETDTWTNTSTKLLENQEVNEALSAYMVEALYENVDVQGKLAGALPPAAKPLAGPAAAGLRQLADDLASKALSRPRVQALWSEANRNAHELFLELVEGGGDTLSSEGGAVALDLGLIVERLGAQLGVDVADKLPPDAARIELVKSDQLSTAQRRGKGVEGPLADPAADHPGPLRPCRLPGPRLAPRGGPRLGDQLDADRHARPRHPLGRRRSPGGQPGRLGVGRTGGRRGLGYRHLPIARRGHCDVRLRPRRSSSALSWPARSDSPKRARRSLAPLLRERPTAYAAAAFVVLLLLWWGPTEGFRRPLPLLMLLGLFIAGIEALRGQTLREFPQETWDTLRDRWSARFAERSSRSSDAKASGGGANAEAARVDELERLVALRDAGALNAEEFNLEKQRLLGLPGTSG